MRRNIDSPHDKRLGSEEEKHDNNALTDKGERKRVKESRRCGCEDAEYDLRGLWRGREINMCSALPNGDIQFVRLKLLPRCFSNQPPPYGRELALPHLPSSCRHQEVLMKGVPRDQVVELGGCRCWTSVTGTGVGEQRGMEADILAQCMSRCQPVLLAQELLPA